MFRASQARFEATSWPGRGHRAGLSSDARDTVIVESVLALAAAFGVRVGAEGIEDDEAWRQLRELACSRGQGFAIGRPMDVNDFEDWHHSRSAKKAAYTNQLRSVAG